MNLNPFDGIADFALGLIKQGKMQAWLKLTASTAASVFVTFFGTFGISVAAQYHSGVPAGAAFVLGLAYACIAMAIIVIQLWTKSPLTKGLPLAWTGKVEVERLRALQDGGTVYTDNDKR